ncbi:hypothetical protein LR48_Vigan393s002400 [Vigna angularis]|uniref:Uncharacterized protein n=1 Tax=Phaseolus angularis TaxID=3914 RepID=A0A0L9T8Z4_PHAAN|nr:hypothetical protein LR48_Vigan393s002400 [Vigna angularis]
MSSLWFLKLIVRCLDHCAWPLLALGYPLCASVQAIETESYKATKDLISYWILLSLIYLFEYAFFRLLQWYQFWPYTKLMIIFWLIVPDFGRASYAYNNIIRTCISNPQASIRSLNNWRKNFVKKDKDNFLLHADRYLEENGTEALMKLIASKVNIYIANTTNKPDAQATIASRVTDHEEMQQTNVKNLQTEPKATKDSEVIEKKEIPTGNQNIPVVPKLVQSENASATMLETNGIVVKEKGVEELPQIFTHKEVQKEWTCALCHVTTTSEKTLNSHLQGSKHRQMEIAMKAKNQSVSQKLKSDHSKEELKQKNIYQPKFKTKNREKPTWTNNSEIRCEICNVKCPCEITLASHRKGKKHLAKLKV